MSHRDDVLLEFQSPFGDGRFPTFWFTKVNRYVSAVSIPFRRWPLSNLRADEVTTLAWDMSFQSPFGDGRFLTWTIIACPPRRRSPGFNPLSEMAAF